MPDKHEFEDVKLNADQEKKQEEQELPAYFRPIEASEMDEDRLIQEIFDEFQAIQEEQEDAGLREQWEKLINQFKGELEEDEDRQFNLHRPSTKIKVRGCARLTNQAFFESDPIYNISPRSEFAKEGGYDVAAKQTDFLDYKLDTEESFKRVKQKVVKWAYIVGIGIEKMYHNLKRRKRIRNENWKGNPIPVAMNKATGDRIFKNEPLTQFLSKYPDAPKKYIDALKEGKEINIKVRYMETSKNDPLPKVVDPRNFYVRKNTDGYEGLCDTKLIVERVEYFWWELEAGEKKGYFRNIDDLRYKYDKKGNKKSEKKNYKTDVYYILECTYLCRLKEDDDEEVKCVFWIGEDSRKCIGASHYPWEGIECIYNPHYVLQEEEGFYQPGVAEDLTDLNIAEDAFLNFGLEGAWISNMVTPIAPKNSDIDIQFLNKNWAHGLPIHGERGEFDFLQKYMKPTSLPDVIAVLQILAKAQDDVSGHSQLMTGRESEIDPEAPARKTLALMQQSGVNIRDYIKCLLPSFNRTAEMLLQMYYQISREGRKYKMRDELDQVVGGNPFATIERNEMIARTNIEARALSFDFDKLNEKRLDLALYQVIRQELMIAGRPEAVHTLLKHLIAGWSPKWKNLINTLLPPLKKLKQEEQVVALNAAAQYLQLKEAQAKQAGVPVDINVQELTNVVNQARKDLVTPPSKEEMKARQNA